MISEKFTIEDIHKIRYENYERTKNNVSRRIDKIIPKRKRRRAEGLLRN